METQAKENNRKQLIIKTSIIGIAANVLMALAKVIVGAIANSIAMISEGINSATDALASVLTLLGTKLAGKHPDEKHPFGYGRIEYLTSLVISVLILTAGLEMLISSVKLIFKPEPVDISVLSLVVIFVTAVGKFILGVYIQKMGKKSNSIALVGIGEESKGDSFASLITIVSSLIFLIFHISLDAYAGVLMSLLILKAGYETIYETVSNLLGKPGQKELADQIYRQIRETEGVIGAADMMLHNYGPDAYSGSINVEMDHNLTVGQTYSILHKLQLRIMHEQHVTMVFGVYAVDNDNEYIHELRKNIATFVKAHEHVKSYHAVYIAKDENKIYCDLIVDYKLRNWDQLREEFTAYIAKFYPDRRLEMTIETEYV